MKKYLSFGIFYLALIIASPLYFPASVSAKGVGLIIDSFQIGDTDSGYNEFIVVANSTDQTVNLNGYSLKKKPGSGSYTSLVSNFGDFELEPGRKITITNSRSNVISKDFTYGSSISDNTALILFDSHGLISDVVGYGDAVVFEGNALPNPEAGEIFSRSDMVDTDNNLNDFYSSSNVLIDKNTEKLLITEIMPNPSEGSEWFELYNPTNSRINLNGLKICDGLGSTHCYYFAKDDYIDSGYKTYDKGQTKITLNDSGDYLTLSNASDEVIMETDGFEGADDGISFSLFGIDWKWTKSATKGSTNIFEDIVEVEERVVKKAKPKTTKKTTKKKVDTIAEEDNEEPTVTLASKETGGQVKSAETEAPKQTATKALITNKIAGWGLVVLAIIGLVFYTIKESKDKIYEIYLKIRNRNG